jgi:hypothetical protein
MMAGLLDDPWIQGMLAAQQAGLLNFPPQSKEAMQMLMAMGQAGQSIGKGAGQFAQHQADWASFPGRMYQGVQPETPGMLSEEDAFRQRHLAQQPYEWGPQTAFSEVFWPRMGGAGQVTSGAGSKIVQPSFGRGANENIPISPRELQSLKVQGKTSEARAAIEDALQNAPPPDKAQGLLGTIADWFKRSPDKGGLFAGSTDSRIAVPMQGIAAAQGSLERGAMSGDILGIPSRRAALAGVSEQQRVRLGPMVSQLEKLGATSEQINTFTPQQAYDFIKARNVGAE